MFESNNSPFWVQQVMDFFIVYFHVGHLDLKADSGVLVTSDPVKQFVTQPRDQSLGLRTAHHRIRLARPCNEERRLEKEGRNWSKSSSRSRRINPLDSVLPIIV